MRITTVSKDGLCAGSGGAVRKNRTASIDRPDARCGNLDQVPVQVAKIEAVTAKFPGVLLFHRDSVFRQPRFPVCQLRGWNREGDMQFAVAIVRRGACTRAALLEQQQYLAVAGFHGAAALPEIANHAKPEELLVKPGGTGHVGYVQRGLQNSFRVRMHVGSLIL